MRRIKEQIDLIIHYTAKEFMVSPVKIRGYDRTLQVAMARHIAMALSKRTSDPTLSFKTVGHYFSDRDHSTVMNSCQKADDYYQTDKNFRESTDAIVKAIQTHMMMGERKVCVSRRVMNIVPSVYR